MAGRIGSVLVATDFSPRAATALDRASWLPLARQPTFHVAHVLPSGIPPELRQAVHDRAEAELARAVDRLARSFAERTGRRAAVVPALLRGTPSIEIIRHARVRGAELVVVGRHGRRPVRDLFLGSTAERVIRKGDVPILLVNRRPAGSYRRPLIAVDLTDVSRRVIELALAVIDGELRSIPLLHAAEPPFARALARSVPDRTLAEYRREAEAAAAASARQLIAELGELPYRLDAVVRPGDPRYVVVDEAERRRADLLVLGTHARSGLAHALLGSVAEWALRAASCDVAVARAARFAFGLP